MTQLLIWMGNFCFGKTMVTRALWEGKSWVIWGQKQVASLQTFCHFNGTFLMTFQMPESKQKTCICQSLMPKNLVLVYCYSKRPLHLLFTSLDLFKALRIPIRNSNVQRCCVCVHWMWRQCGLCGPAGAYSLPEHWLGGQKPALCAWL